MFLKSDNLKRENAKLDQENTELRITKALFELHQEECEVTATLAIIRLRICTVKPRKHKTQGTVLKILLNSISCKQYYMLCLDQHLDLASMSC